MATMAKDTYIPRLIDRKIDQYLNLFGAVEISGTKWCGKTWSALAHANSAIYADRGSNQLLIESDPQYALVGATPHVIDEWQRVPQVWDCVRHAVDDTTEKGQWILTGSSTPAKDKVSHSGAGRIGRLSMHPMSLQESGDSTGKVSLAALFKGEFAPCPCASGIDSLTELICRGGWPDALALTSDTIRPVLMGYLEAVHNKSVPDLGGRELISSRVAESLARNLGQSSTNVTLARDVFALDGALAPTDTQKREVSQHLEYLVQLYLIDELPGWVPASRSPNRMRTKPKRYFADPSLAIAALGLNKQNLLEDYQTLGLAFENLCMRDLQVYASSLDAAGSHPVRYYRDDSDLEIDAVIELADGTWGAFEIKLSETKVEQAANSLLRMRDKLLSDKMGRTKPPSFLAVLTGMGEIAYKRPDGVYVIPIRAFGA